MNMRIQAARHAYEPILEDIRHHIETGALRGGERLPSETALSRKYGVGINTVRKGLAILVAEGVLRRQRGAGTYIEPTATQKVNALAVRDHIGLILPAAPREYHPFFSERREGIRAEAERRGYRIWEYAFDSSVCPVGWDFTYHNYDIASVARDLEENDSLAGVIASEVIAGELPVAVREQLPMVCNAPSDLCSSVDYDWGANQRQALSDLVLHGCRSIWVHGILSDSTAVLERQLAALVDEPVRLRSCPTPQRCTRSELISHAFQSSCQVLETGKIPDGMLASSDYSGQGVADAITHHLAQKKKRSKAKAPALSILACRAYVLETALPHTRYCADGYLLGCELVRLLEQSIQDKIQSPSNITLQCMVQRFM